MRKLTDGGVYSYRKVCASIIGTAKSEGEKIEQMLEEKLRMEEKTVRRSRQLVCRVEVGWPNLVFFFYHKTGKK